VFYFSVTLPIVIIRELWFDELITLYTVRFHSLSQLWATLKAGVDLNPPLYHLTVWGSEKLLGENAMGLRLPSVLAYWVMTVCLFVLVRRRTKPLCAMLAALFPLATLAPVFAWEARPYTLVLACGVLMLLCWQKTTEPGPRGIALAGLSLSLAAALCNHYYAALLVIPIAVGELVRSRETWKLDWPVWAVLVLGTLPLPFLLPLVKGGMAAHKDPFVWNKPILDLVWITYGELLGYAAFAVLLLIAWMLVRSVRSAYRRAEPSTNAAIPVWEIAAGIALCALPVVAFVLAVAWVGMISPRYMMPTVIGFALMFAYGAHTIAPARRGAALLLLVALVGWSTIRIGRAARDEFEARDRYELLETQQVALTLDLPIIVQDAVLELPVNYYVSPALRSRMLFPLDLDDVHRYALIASGEKLLMVIGRDTFPIATTDFNQFRRVHKRYLVYGLSAGWLLATVIHDGGKVYILHNGRFDLLFLVNEKTSGDASLAKTTGQPSPLVPSSRPTAATTAHLVKHP